MRIMVGFVALLTAVPAIAAEPSVLVLSGDSPRITVERSSPNNNKPYVTKIDGKVVFAAQTQDSALLVASKLLVAREAARNRKLTVRKFNSQVSYMDYEIEVASGKGKILSVYAHPGEEQSLHEAFSKVARHPAPDLRSALSSCEAKLSKLSFLAKEGTPVSSSAESLTAKILEITSHHEPQAQQRSQGAQ